PLGQGAACRALVSYTTLQLRCVAAFWLALARRFVVRVRLLRRWLLRSVAWLRCRLLRRPTHRLALRCGGADGAGSTPGARTRRRGRRRGRRGRLVGPRAATGQNHARGRDEPPDG